jgi:N-acetylmuramoyl-L-alanine amidase
MKNRLLKYISVFFICPLILILIYQTIFVDAGVRSIIAGTQGESAFRIPDDISSTPSPRTIIIDPGHGGNDPGTLKNGLMEKDIVLSISKKLQKRLIELGYNVLLTRDEDKTYYTPTDVDGSRVRKDLDGRIKYAKNNNAELFISIHVDSLPEDSRQNGSIVFYYPKLEQSKIYATNVQDVLNNILVNNEPRTKQDIRSENFYVLKYSDMPSILIETGFITNSQDRLLLTQDSFLDKLAEAISEGINK